MSSMSSHNSDHEILDMIQNNNDIEKGYRQLVYKYQEQLYTVVHRMTNNHQDTDDILQNTFIKVYRHIDTFQRKSKLYTWIYRVAVNETFTYLEKKKKKQLRKADMSLVGDVVQSHPLIDGDDISNRLARAIETLPKKQKMVFNLRYFEEMPYQNMADILDTSIGALKASFHHAVKKIEKHVLKNELL